MRLSLDLCRGSQSFVLFYKHGKDKARKEWREENMDGEPRKRNFTLFTKWRLVTCHFMKVLVYHIIQHRPQFA